MAERFLLNCSDAELLDPWIEQNRRRIRFNRTKDAKAAIYANLLAVIAGQRILQSMYFGVYKIWLEKARTARFLECYRKGLRDGGIKQCFTSTRRANFQRSLSQDLQQVKSNACSLEQCRAAYSQNVSVLVARGSRRRDGIWPGLGSGP